MTTKELFSTLQKLQHILIRHSYLHEALYEIKEHHDDIRDLQAEPTSIDPSNHAGIISAVVQVRNRTNEAIKKIKILSRRKIFGEVESLKTSLKSFTPSLEGGGTRILETAVTRAIEFAEIYDKFTGDYSYKNAFALFLRADELRVSVQSISDLASILLEKLKGPDTIDPSVGVFDLYLSGGMDYGDFLAKADAIKVIYEELCSLLHVSYAQNPLRILKVESGSLWTWLQGHPEVVALLSIFLHQAAAYIYRNHTTEGKRKEIPKKVEELESILNFSEKLRERGIETELIQENIKKSAVIIGQQYQRILEAEEFIELNGEKIPLTRTAQEKLLMSKEIRLISNSEPADQAPKEQS